MQLRFNYRLNPTPGQRIALAKAFGCARVVFNDALRTRREAHDAGEHYPPDSELSRRLTAAKHTPQRVWLSEVSSVVLQQALTDLNNAYRNFFDSVSGKRHGRRVAPPRFRSKKDSRQSIRFTRNARFAVTSAGRLRLPKIGDVPLRWSRDLPSEPSSVTVTMDAAGRYHASFVVEVPDQPLPRTDREVGIDLGLSTFAALSDGRKVDNPRFARRAERKLARAQRALTRKQKGSNNRAKAGPGWPAVTRRCGTLAGTGCTSNPRASFATTKRCTWKTWQCPAWPEPGWRGRCTMRAGTRSWACSLTRPPGTGARSGR